MAAALDVFKEKLIRRDISLKALDAGEPQASGKTYKISARIKQGIESENAKKITKLIRDEGPKGVKAQIQGDELRVSGKKRDDLQAVSAAARRRPRRRAAVRQLPLIATCPRVSGSCRWDGPPGPARRSRRRSRPSVPLPSVA